MNDESTDENKENPANPPAKTPANPPAKTPASDWVKDNKYTLGPEPQLLSGRELDKYTAVRHKYALSLNPDYGKDPSVKHRTKYYPETKEWQEVKPTFGALVYDSPSLCAAECDRHPKCKAFYWDQREKQGACFLGTGYDPNTPDFGVNDTSTTYYKS